MTAKLALAGIFAPIWFTTLVVVQSLLQPDYSHVALPISALAAWPYGWVQNLNFFVFSALMLAYAVGLQRGVQPGRANWIGHRVGAVMSFIGSRGRTHCNVARDGG